MSYYSPSIEKLIESFERLPSIGHKTAVRLAFHMLDLSKEETDEFINSIINAKEKLKYCSNCYNISDTDPCPICSSPKRDNSVICVVEDVRDVMAMERTHEFKGVYHVLHGTISPMNGIGPEDIKIKELLNRIANNDIKEIIYYDIKKDRQSNNIKYKKLVNLLEKYLMMNDEGNLYISVPYLVIIKDGKIMYTDNETSIINGKTTPSLYWNQNNIDNFKDKINNYIVEFKGGK